MTRQVSKGEGGLVACCLCVLVLPRVDTRVVVGGGAGASAPRRRAGRRWRRWCAVRTWCSSRYVRCTLRPNCRLLDSTCGVVVCERRSALCVYTRASYPPMRSGLAGLVGRSLVRGCLSRQAEARTYQPNGV